MFDLFRVRQAFANLVANAVKHGVAGEPVTVRADGDERSVRISVENAGELPAEQIAMLLEPLYQRSAPSRRTERSHLGPGLFIVRQIARAHGGDATGTCPGHRVRFQGTAEGGRLTDRS